MHRTCECFRFIWKKIVLMIEMMVVKISNAFNFKYTEGGGKSFSRFLLTYNVTEDCVCNLRTWQDGKKTSTSIQSVKFPQFTAFKWKILSVSINQWRWVDTWRTWGGDVGLRCRFLISKTLWPLFSSDTSTCSFQIFFAISLIRPNTMRWSVITMHYNKCKQLW